MAVHVHNVGIDCNDLERMAGFWKALTGYEAESADDGHQYLVPPDGEGARIYVQKVPERRPAGKNRLHIDLAVSDVGATVRQAEGLGATRAEEHGDGDERWHVLADPEGNLFCVLPA